MSEPFIIFNTPEPIITGSLSPQLQRFTGKYSPTSGWSFDQEFAGLDYGAMLALANTYSAAGCEYELTYQYGKSTLRTVDNRGNITIDTWEIAVNRISRGSFQNPRDMAALSVNDLKVIARAKADGSKLDDAVIAVNADQTSGMTYTKPDVTTPSATQRFFDRVITQDVSDYNFDQNALRHTTNASNRGYYNVADTNVNCLYTQSQLFSEITNGGYWLFPCPNEIQGALNVIFNSFPTLPGTFLNGGYYLKSGLKGGSGRVTAANNRINISTEYSLDVWSTDEYKTI